MTESRWDTAYEWKSVALLSVGFGLMGLARWVIAPLLPFISRDLGLDYQDSGNLIGALGLVWGVTAIFLGGLSDRIGRRRVLIPALIAFSLLSGLSGMVTSLTGLLLLRAVMGASGGAFCPTSFAAVAEISHPSRRGFNLGLPQSAATLLGLALAPGIAIGLLQYTSWHGVFVLVAVPGLITAALLALVMRRPRQVVADGALGATVVARASIKAIFRRRNLGLGLVAAICAMTGIFVLSAMVPNYLIDHLKLAPTQMAFVLSALGYGGFVGQLGLPGLSDLFGRRVVAAMGFALGALFLWLFSEAGPNPLQLFALLFAVAVFAFGVFAVITGPVATEAALPGMIATTIGIIIGVAEIFGGGVAPAVAGTIAQRYGVQCVPYVALAGMVLGVVVAACLQETAPRRCTEAAPGPFAGPTPNRHLP